MCITSCEEFLAWYDVCMDQLPTSENYGNVPNDSESDFGNTENASEDFRNVPKESSESSGNIRNDSEKTEYHTLTVREVAKLFEDSDVPRTERSIINWCNLNKQGIARLDCYYEPNDRKYFITPNSVHRVITEERNKSRNDETLFRSDSERRDHFSEHFGNIPKESSERFRSIRNDSENRFGNIPKEEQTRPENHWNENQSREPEDGKDDRIKELERENLDLKITNKGKDFFIDQLKEDRENFAREREGLINQLVESTRQIGALETKLLQIDAPREGGLGGPAPREETWSQTETPRPEHEVRDETYRGTEEGNRVEYSVHEDRPYPRKEPRDSGTGFFGRRE